MTQESNLQPLPFVATRKWPGLLGVMGVLVGLLVIHPATMVMNMNMTSGAYHSNVDSFTTIDMIRSSFTTPSGWVWGFGYAFLCGFIGLLFGSLKARERTLEHLNVQLARETEKSDQLLFNILPRKVANELKHKGYSAPRNFDDVTILFADLVGFSRIAAETSPAMLIGELNEMFTGFDTIMQKNDCERLKTIGDAYLAVCGMPEENPRHASNMVRSAVEMIEFLDARNRESSLKWEIRIGVHTGDVVGGVVGVSKYIYDVFGDTVNCAARLEQHSTPMRINISDATKNLISDSFRCTSRGRIETKEGRLLHMYFVERGS